MRPTRSFFLRPVAGILFAALGTFGCGGGPALPTAPTPPPESVKSLTFLFLPAQSREAPVASANDVVQSALISAGYRLTTDPNDAYDAQLSVAATATETQSFMTMEVNGQRVRNFHVRLTLTVKDGGTIADQRVDEFDESGGEAKTGNGLAVANDLTDSLRFRQWARAHHASASATASASAGAPN